MDIPTMHMAEAEALERYREYRRAVLATPNPSDETLMRGYRTLARGKTVIDLVEVMRTAGLDDQDRPKLAIVRADAERVHCHVWRSDGSARFAMDRWTRPRASRRWVDLAAGTFTPTGAPSGRTLTAIVPSIPPRFRPRHALSNYHLLWEAEWQDVPRDPILLRRLGGMLFAVLAQWDLTDLERAVLRGR